MVTALGYGTTGLTVGQRVAGLADWTRDGTLADYVAVEARNFTPISPDVEHTAAAALPSGLTACRRCSCTPASTWGSGCSRTARPVQSEPLRCIAGTPAAAPVGARFVFFVVEADRVVLARLMDEARQGRLSPRVDAVCSLDDEAAAIRARGRTIVQVRA